MTRPDLERLRRGLRSLAQRRPDFVDFSAEASNLLGDAISFDRCCWHTVDPGTVLFTGSVNRDVGCSGRWLADHEYVIDDVNQWWKLARSGQLVGRTSEATSGDLSRSARYRSVAAAGAGDELRVAMVLDGVYWGAAGLLRDDDRPWFSEDDEGTARAVVDVLAAGCRSTLISAPPQPGGLPDRPAADGPGVIILDEHDEVESITAAAARWIGDFHEEPAPATPAESKVVLAVAASARARGLEGDPIASPSRARVRTRSGEWLVVYGSLLAGERSGWVVIVVQPAMPTDLAPVLALAFGLTNRERDVALLCVGGGSTKQIARALGITAYTVQDHLKSIFDKTGTRTRNELVGRIFLSHYATRWEPALDAPAGWIANVAAEVVASPPATQ